MLKLSIVLLTTGKLQVLVGVDVHKNLATRGKTLKH